MEFPPIHLSADAGTSVTAPLSEKKTPADSATDFDKSSRPVPTELVTLLSEDDAGVCTDEHTEVPKATNCMLGDDR